MMDSGAASRIVQALLGLLGEKRASAALASSGFLLAIPVFFDTVFYLLVPLARSMYRMTGRSYLRYVLAVCAGAVAAHTLVPPTPGPLVVASTLGIDLGTMMVTGLAVGIPGAMAGLAFAAFMDRRMPVAMRTESGGVPSPAPEPVSLPGLVPSLVPIVLPVVLISANTMMSAFGVDVSGGLSVGSIVVVAGNPNLALLFAAGAALWVYARQRRATASAVAAVVETSLMSGGLIILITAAGGAFGAMLQSARIGDAIQSLSGAGASGQTYLFLGFGVSALMKVAQGSSTVAMITTSAMLAAMIGDGAALPFHVVYVATAIGSGALVGSWMNDSGFWVVSRMSGLTEVETLRSWTPLLAVVGVTSMVVTVLMALVLPLH
jgi:GntP family gluconate:H+ symporter